MHCLEVWRGTFADRSNRFIAHAELDGQRMVCHIKNTGCYREFPTSEAIIYLQESDNSNRETRHDPIAVGKGGLLINMGIQALNQVFRKWAGGGGSLSGLSPLRLETTWGNSCFDLYRELSTGRRGFVEVKGITLEENSYAHFPDAPTEWGVKYPKELIACRTEGYETAVCLVLQMSGMREFIPNDGTHPIFGAALRRATVAGVQTFAQECMVILDSITIAGAVSIRPQGWGLSTNGKESRLRASL